MYSLSLSLSLFSFSNLTQLKVKVVEAGVGAVVGVVVGSVVGVVVVVVLMIGTVRLAKRIFFSFLSLFSSLLIPITATLTRSSIKAGVVTMATPNSRMSRLPLQMP